MKDLSIKLKGFTLSIAAGLAIAAALAISGEFGSAKVEAQGFGSGQAYGFVDITTDLATPTVAGGATSNGIPAVVIDCTRVKDVALQVKFTFANTTTSNVVYTVCKSIDGANWETTPCFTWTIAGNGTTSVTSTTNLTVGGLGYLKLTSIQNTHASIVVTNNQVAYSIKRNAP